MGVTVPLWREKENLFRYQAYFESNFLGFARARTQVCLLMTRKLCAAGMRIAIETLSTRTGGGDGNGKSV